MSSEYFKYSWVTGDELSKSRKTLIPHKSLDLKANTFVDLIKLSRFRWNQNQENGVISLLESNHTKGYWNLFNGTLEKSTTKTSIVDILKSIKWDKQLL